MIKKIIIGSFACLSCVAITACSNHANAYLTQSGTSPSLVLPAHQKAAPLNNNYPLPTIKGHGTKTPSLVPPGLDLQKYAPKKKK